MLYKGKDQYSFHPLGKLKVEIFFKCFELLTVVHSISGCMASLKAFWQRNLSASTKDIEVNYI